jgi:hypothetical protein
VRARVRGDDGATLVVALIFITVVALGIAVTLSFADTSLRTTQALRDQAAAVANADGAAQVAINELRRGDYTGTGNCFGGQASLLLRDFYRRPSGPADSAFVTCTPDATRTGLDNNVLIDDDNKPPFAILTLATNFNEEGINVEAGTGRTLEVKGPIFSNSTIDVDSGRLSATGSVTARRGCEGTIISTPPPNCTIGFGGSNRDPNYSQPSGGLTERSVPSCGRDDLVRFRPGVYRDVDALNDRTRSSGCRDSIFWFQPGTYYFDFDDDEPWVIDTGSVVAGAQTTTAPLVAGTTPSMPGSCQSPFPPTVPAPPGWTRQEDGGVQFVFGGESRIVVRQARVEICGPYSESRPPIAVYGLRSDVGSGSSRVDEQNGCIVDTSGGCDVIRSDNAPNSRLFVQGTVYVPRASVDIALNNNTGQVFSNGIIARSLDIDPTGSADLDDPVIEVADDITPFGRRTVVFLTVHVCPGTDTCSASGRLRLRAKVGIIDPSGSVVAGEREVTVYSWSVQR